MDEIELFCKSKNIEIIINYEFCEVVFKKIYRINDERKGRMLTMKLFEINEIVNNCRLNYFIDYLGKYFQD